MSNLYLLPVVVFVLFQYVFIGTYIAAVIQGHVVPTIPYISDAATYSPESCVFAQFINIGCVLLGLVIYIRYRHTIQLYSRHADLRRLTERMNNKALWIGFGSCLGISIVGNFQETNVRIAHYVGAISCFGCGTVYFWMQAVISYYLQPYLGTMAKAHIRLGLSVLCTVLFFVIAVTGLISHILFNGQDPRKWYPSDGGWEYHIASSISEWLMSTAFCFYILTFTDEFRGISVNHPQLSFLDLDDDEKLNEPAIYEENTLISPDTEIIS